MAPLVAALTDAWSVIAFAIIVVAVLLVLRVLLRMLRHSPNIRVTRFGIFVERERFEDKADDAEEENEDD